MRRRAPESPAAQGGKAPEVRSNLPQPGHLSSDVEAPSTRRWLASSKGAARPTMLPSYLQVVDLVGPIMQRLPGAIVSIDGRDGVGKTTLGRYLAWHFNVTLIETDLFLIPTRDYVVYLDDQINRIIERRITSPLPVIIEGVAMLQLMKRINRIPDFFMYLTNPQQSSSPLMERQLFAYEAAFTPATKANIVVRVDL
jgi:hypothetical protein